MAELNKVISVGAGTNTASIKTSDGKILPWAVLTELSIERSWTTQDLDGGDNMDPEDVALTGKSYSVKAKCNAMYAEKLAALVDGTVTTGGDAFADETVTLSASVHTFTTTHSAATPVNQGVILADGSLGEIVAADPAVGQYTYAAGVWTFNNAEVGEVHCRCRYTDPTLVTVSEGGGTVGDPAYVELFQAITYKGGVKNLRIPKAMVSKVSESGKSKEHTTYDVEFKPYKDATTGKTVITSWSK